MDLCQQFSSPNTWIEDLNRDLTSYQWNIMKHAFGLKNAGNLWDEDEFQVLILIQSLWPDSSLC